MTAKEDMKDQPGMQPTCASSVSAVACSCILVVHKSGSIIMCKSMAIYHLLTSENDV